METNRLRESDLIIMKTLIDTSFLLHCAEKGRDFLSLAEEKIGEPLECYVIEEVLEELKALAAKGGKRGAMASTALKIAEKMKIIRAREEKIPVDEKLLREAERANTALASLDSELIRKARKRGIPLILVASDQRIIFEGVRL